MTLWVVASIIFFLMTIIPGDAVLARFEGQSFGAQFGILEQYREELGLNKPAYVRYWDYITDLLRGDLGLSVMTREPVWEALKARVPVTLTLALVATLIKLVIGIPGGVIAALRRNRLPDIAATVFAVFGVAIPNFWLGIMLILVFGVTLGWLPVSGYVSPWSDPIEGLRRLILPGFALGTAQAAAIMRQTRSSMLEVLSQQYITTAKAKGLSPWTVIVVHALKNALLPVVTLLGLSFGRLLGGAVIMETVFSIPGMGRYAVAAITNQDFVIVQSVVILMALIIISSNFLADIAYGVLDPRIRYE